MVPRRRADDPDAWLVAAYDDDSITTQVYDGESSGPDGIGVLPSAQPACPPRSRPCYRR
ncbi:MAG: hypothetical protein ACRDTG_10825 [Pseudonocardiaceae bacterium]